MNYMVSKSKNYKQQEKEKQHGKKGFRLRKELEKEGDSILKELKKKDKDAN